jgi:hypothetical protein
MGMELTWLESKWVRRAVNSRLPFIEVASRNGTRFTNNDYLWPFRKSGTAYETK